MDWITQLNAALFYIEDNLDGEISYAQIAKMTNCSIYNFQRIFSYVANQPLSAYIRNRRLTLAAFDVLNTQDKLIDIGLKYGYASQDAFARAFKAFHGALPSQVRSQPARLRSCPKLAFQLTIQGGVSMDFQIEQWPAFTVAGFRHTLETERAFDIVPGLWEDAWKSGDIQRLFALLQQADCRPAGLIGMAMGGQWGDAEQMQYIIGVTNHVDVPGAPHTPAPEGMEEIPVRAATWAIFEADGPLPEATQTVYARVYGEWLPLSRYVLDDLPVIECYFQDNRQQVWVAVKKK